MSEASHYIDQLLKIIAEVSRISICICNDVVTKTIGYDIVLKRQKKP